MFRVTQLTSFILLVVVSGSASAQTLEGMRAEVREESARSRKKKKKRPDRDRDSRHAAYDDDEEDDYSLIEQLTGHIFLASLKAPFVAPIAALNDSGGPGYYPKYPYGKHDGSLLYDPGNRGAHSSLLVLQGDYGTDFSSLTQAHGRVFGDLDNRLGFDTEFFYRQEELRPGTDELWHGDFNLTYRFAQSEHWQFRAGLGVNWLADDLDTDFGFNATYNAEWFPVKPWYVSSSLDWGRVGSASLLHLRNTVGVTKSGWGIFTGYDYFSIGDEKIHSWINGIEYRF